MQFKRQRVDVFRRKNEKRLAQDDRSGDLLGQDGEVNMGKCRDLTPGQARNEEPATARERIPSGGSLDRVVG
jgi:hypothetical protein